VPLVIVSKLIPAGRGLAAALVRRASVVALDWDTRQKSRFEALDSAGRRLAVFLPRGRIARGGDVLVGEDGSLIRVDALAQPILVVSPAASLDPASAALALAKAAYHLGNRHVPLEVRADRLVLEPDHVLAEMLARMGLQVATASGAFEPEPGAYDAPASHAHEKGRAHGGANAHEHAHDHSHDRSHDHSHDHSPASPQDHVHDDAHDHVHDDSCGHAHEHPHAAPTHAPKPRGKAS